MGKRTIIECDWCKQELREKDPALIKVTIKHPNKKGHSFEVCRSCGEDILTRLMAFDIAPEPTKRPETPPDNLDDSEDEDAMVTHVEALEIARKRREELAKEASDEPEAAPGVQEVVLDEENEVVGPARERIITSGPARAEVDVCSHPNKTEPRFGKVKGDDGKAREIMYRKCIDCGVSVPLPTLKERTRYLRETDENLKTHNSETRRR